MRLIKKAKFACASLFYTLYFLWKAIFSSKITSKSKKKGVAVSLTTYGWRYNFVFLTIESILSQSVQPEAIYLWIFEKDNCSPLTRWILDKQCKRGLIIKKIDTDVRSYKKLSYMLKEPSYDYHHIITADDDVLYPAKWIDNFISHPKYLSHILCNRARVITYDKNNEDLLPYKFWPLATLLNNETNYLLPTGVSGICYPVAALDERVYDFSAIHKFCPTADDIWYKMVTLSNGFHSFLIQDHIKHYPLVVTSLTKGLEKSNVFGDMNDKQIKESLSYFGLNKKSLRKII